MSIWDPEYRKAKAETKNVLIRSGQAMYGVSIIGCAILAAASALGAAFSLYQARQIEKKEEITEPQRLEAATDRSVAKTFAEVALLMAAGTVVSVRAYRKDRQIINNRYP